jgi:hypothetical protein
LLNRMNRHIRHRWTPSWEKMKHCEKKMFFIFAKTIEISSFAFFLLAFLRLFFLEYIGHECEIVDLLQNKNLCIETARSTWQNRQDNELWKIGVIFESRKSIELHDKCPKNSINLQ